MNAQPSSPRPEGERPTFLGHPPGLFVLFFAEMWERFCYYGMRGLLVLYLTKSLLMSDGEAYGIYGAYTALVYAAPVVGGRLADGLLGYRRAVILGALLMALGEFLLLGDQTLLFVGMAFIVIGNGLFKPNISSIVGGLYETGDARRDSGFTIFYIGINLGALGATTICAYVGETYGYPYGFGLAGLGMLLATAIFSIFQGKLEGRGLPPDPGKLNEPWLPGGLTRWHATLLGCLAAVPALYLLLSNEQVVNYLLVVVGIYVFRAVLVEGRKVGGKIQADRTIVFFVLVFVNVLFWSLFEQAGTSLTLFADRAVDRSVFGFEMTAANTQSFNPLFIIMFGSAFSAMWVILDRYRMNPNIPLKFGLGTLQLGAGFLLLVLGAQFAGADHRVPLVFLVGMYLLHTTGELFVSPVGLSMVTKLAPPTMTGMVMGAWFLSWAIANKLAAGLATLTGAEEGAVDAAKLTAEQALHTYVGVYQNFGFAILGVGFVLVIASRPLSRMMHGVT